MKVLILAAGPIPTDAPARSYPVALTEHDGHPLIELIMAKCSALPGAQIIVAVDETEGAHSHLDEVVRLIDPTTTTLRVRHPTRGAACTALLAIDQINGADELLILNANELLEADFDRIVEGFRASTAAAGVVTFPAIHPRYSYVRIDDSGLVIEAAEKRPISRTATAGFYWFRHGTDFVAGAQRMIEKGDSVDGVFYVCPVLNQLILRDVAVAAHEVAAEAYHPLKDDRQIFRYEAGTVERKP